MFIIYARKQYQNYEIFNICVTSTEEKAVNFINHLNNFVSFQKTIIDQMLIGFKNNNIDFKEDSSLIYSKDISEKRKAQFDWANKNISLKSEKFNDIYSLPKDVVNYLEIYNHAFYTIPFNDCKPKFFVKEIKEV